MIKGIHIPIKELFQSKDIQVQELEESYRDSARTSAVIIPDTNDFGTKVGKTGPMNGVTIDLPPDMPTTYFSTKRDKHNHSLYFEDPDASRDDTFSLPSTTTVYESLDTSIPESRDTTLNTSRTSGIYFDKSVDEDTDTESVLTASLADVSISNISQYD